LLIQFRAQKEEPVYQLDPHAWQPDVVLFVFVGCDDIRHDSGSDSQRDK
jgi:hypothetical protein